MLEDDELFEAYDMTLESLVCKIMWIRGLTSKKEEIKELLYQSIHHDINL